VGKRDVKVDQLVAAVLETPGHTGRPERRAAFDGTGDYARKVAESSYRVTDADLAALQEAGMSEDAVLEITLAAAVGAALAALDAALAQL
jgi:alkylhydroperoxidase family enzyme